MGRVLIVVIYGRDDCTRFATFDETNRRARRPNAGWQSKDSERLINKRDANRVEPLPRSSDSNDLRQNDTSFSAIASFVR